jgi:Fibronectin type III domain
MGLMRGSIAMESVVQRGLFWPAGWSSSSPLIGGGAIPPAPTNLAFTGGGESSVVLTWTASAGATTYNVYRKVAGGGYTLIATGLTSATYTDSALANGTVYLYVVTAVNSSGESPPSNSVTVTYVVHAYVLEDNVTYYVAENGATFYVQES